MEIFKTSPESHYEQIVAMGPRWLTEFAEMDANYKYAAWTLDLMEHFLNRLINNQFPTYCDLDTLTVLERLMDIPYYGTPSEEERRRTVSTYWSATGKLNKSMIVTLTREYTGNSRDVDVEWNGTTLVIDFNNTDTVNVEYAVLYRLIKRLIPAHIPFMIRCVCSVAVGLYPGIKRWKHYFDMTGTIPGVNTGLVLRYPEIELDPEGTGWMANRLVTGEVEAVTGTYPITAIGLDSANEGLVSEITATGWPVVFQHCGDESEL